MGLTQISRISRSTHRKLACAIRDANARQYADSKGEATCLREIREICVKLKIFICVSLRSLRELIRVYSCNLWGMITLFQGFRQKLVFPMNRQ